MIPDTDRVTELCLRADPRTTDNLEANDEAKVIRRIRIEQRRDRNADDQQSYASPVHSDKESYVSIDDRIRDGAR
jgi:hypothetical protein